jgi:PAS domain S-box-containing protein
MNDNGPRELTRRSSEPASRAAAGPKEDLFRSIADSSSAWEYLLDPDGRTLWASPSCVPVTGHSPDEFLKDPGLLERVVHPEDRAPFASHRLECQVSGHDEETEFRVVRTDGGVRWIGHRCRSMVLPGGMLGRRCSNHDITERKAAEARLRELNDTLEERVFERTAEAEERAAQLWSLASSLTHAEVRERQRLSSALHDYLQQVLAAAKLNLDAVAARSLPDQVRSEIAHVGELLDKSIAECRSLTAGLSPPVLRESGLAAALAWLTRRMQEEHGLRADLTVADGDVEPLDADVKVLLFDAARELLFNVVKHSGVLEARVTLRRAERHVEVRVEDRGGGFETDVLRDRRREGAGLGLFSIRKRLELVGGLMSVESAPGRGTSVTLRSPAGPNAAKASESAQPPATAGKDAPGKERTPCPSGCIRVVIADDHQILRQGLIALLRVEPGIAVVGEAADGIEAVELARSLAPDVVIMDVTMPRMNGIEATRQIAAELPAVKVVGLSMHEDETIAAAMRKAGAVDFVTKGGRSGALISAIREAASSGRTESTHD